MEYFDESYTYPAGKSVFEGYTYDSVIARYRESVKGFEFMASNAPGAAPVRPQTMEPFVAGEFPGYDHVLTEYSEFVEFFQTISFKMPGWHLVADVCCVWNSCRVMGMVRASFDTVDRYRPGEPTKLTGSVVLSKGQTKGVVVAEIRHFIHKMMTHEADEWLTVDNYMIFNPHA